MLVGVEEGYKLWSASYDHESNALLSLERRVIGQRLGLLAGRCLIDIGTGTGYWLRYALSLGARALGLDLSAEMLAEAANKPELRRRLIRADMNILPLKMRWPMWLSVLSRLATFLQLRISSGNWRGCHGV